MGDQDAALVRDINKITTVHHESWRLKSDAPIRAHVHRKKANFAVLATIVVTEWLVATALVACLVLIVLHVLRCTFIGSSEAP